MRRMVTNEIRQAMRMDFFREEDSAMVAAPLGLTPIGETAKSQRLFDRFAQMRIRGTQDK